MAWHYPELAPDQHEEYVRHVLESVSEHLVLRCLYDAVVAQLRPPHEVP